MVTLAWAAGSALLFALFLRISLTTPRSQTSDPANNALQAWDLLHGHLLLHGWILGDATFYTFELPLIAAVEAFFGLRILSVQVAVALVFLIVTGCAAAIAVTGSRGAARAARFFGQPASTYRVGEWEILVYDKNVLQEIAPADLTDTS